jgi:hypothetical protein
MRPAAPIICTSTSVVPDAVRSASFAANNADIISATGGSGGHPR